MPKRPAGNLSLLFDVWLVTHVLTGLLDQALTPLGLTADEFGFVTLLRRFGPATPTQISQWTGMRATTVSAAAKRLADRGQLRRTPHPTDRRSALLTLSPAGVEAHQEAAAAVRKHCAPVQATLGSEEAAGRLDLQRLDAALRSALGLADRPYTLADDQPNATGWQLCYDGAPLSAAQEKQARAYLDFLRGTEGGAR